MRLRLGKLMPNLSREEKDVYLKLGKGHIHTDELLIKLKKNSPWTFLHFTQSGTEKSGSAVSGKIIYKILMKLAWAECDQNQV